MLITLPDFAKQYGINKKVLYNLTEKEEPPEFLVRKGSRWYVDTTKPAAKKLAKEGHALGEPVAAGESADRRATLQKAREDKAIADARIKQFKADQEEIKLGAMIGDYIDVGLMRYYFSFFQRGISDSFASIKKISPELKRLYAADKDKEAEKVFLTELGICFSNAVRALEDEVKKDTGKKDSLKKPRKTG
ncbi:MAG: hypothetical protein LBL28_07910 [Treponema sp.]|jgi:hypothetical protein|nr:hypothetical protein [Treponema sp.]